MQGFPGFVLQATYRIHQNVPVVYLFGRLEDGRNFQVRDNRQRPHFYMHAEHAPLLQQAVSQPRHGLPRHTRVESSAKVDFYGNALSRVEVGIPAEAPKVRDFLHAQGKATFEADVRFATRYLIDRGIRGGLIIYGEPRDTVGRDLIFDNPEVRAAEVKTTPNVLSFDIETNPHTDRLLAIAMYSENGAGLDEVVVVDPDSRNMPPNAIGVATEKAALAYFCRQVKERDIDILTGWNVIDFDLSQLQKFADRLRFDLHLGREGGRMRIRPAEGYFGSGSANIPGRVVLDGLDLVRGAFLRLDEYSLDAVANSVLGEGKTFTTHGQDKVAEILDTHANDLPAFCNYARTDARLAMQIVEHLDLIELALARSALTGMTPDRVAASIASFDHLYLSALHARNIAAPSVAEPGAGRIAQGGGAVFEPTAGMHSNVWVCDFKSLYPSIIRSFNIDPLGFAQAAAGAPSVKTVDGTAFASEPAILPTMLNALFPQRAAAKARGDEVASQAIKILMNSFYGVLGTPACRFYNPQIANAITSQGRALLNWSKAWFETRGYAVLYGDTDSVFVASGLDDADEAVQTAEALVTQFNAELSQELAERYGIESALELEFEKLYSKLFLARTRGGGQGARKRYAGIRHGQDEVEFVGMEVVRRDWTELAKDVQRTLFERLFRGEEVVGYLAQTVGALRAGQLDDKLVYRKGLRKAVESYTTNIPPHVQAIVRAREAGDRRAQPRVVHYVITDLGPELIDSASGGSHRGNIDREHYLQKQLRPVAEPVLEAMGLNFEKVIGDDRQIALF